MGSESRVATHDGKQLNPDARPQTPAQHQVFDALQSFCLNGPTCHPDQELIAARAGYGREYVNRVLAQLKELGLVTWERRRRNGSSFDHNVYTLAYWVPQLRHRHKRNLAHAHELRCEMRRRRLTKEAERTQRREREQISTVCSQGRDHMKENCHPAKGPTTRSLSSEMGLENQRCGRERANTSHNRRRIEISAHHDLSNVVVPIRRDWQHEIPCARCGQLEDLIRHYEDVQVRQEQTMAGMEQQARQHAATVQKLKQELAAAREDEPDAQEIRQILEYWKRKLGHPKAKSPLAGKRAKLVRQALKHHTAAELREAIDGLALVPYVGPRGRTSNSHGTTRYDELEYALKDETKVAKMRDHARKARSAAEYDLPGLWAAYEHHRAAEVHISGLILAGCQIRDAMAEAAAREQAA